MVGLVGLFKDPYHLLRAARAFRKKGFHGCDALTPYPVHGLEEALGIRRSWIPWVTLVFGLAGCFGGLWLQVWTSAVDWPLNVGGKPMLSIPAFIPVTFECTVLLGGLATAAALFLICRLPAFHPRILDREITNDVFALYVPAKTENFREEEIQRALEKAGAYEVKKVE